MITLSVVVPTYNRREVLQRTVRCLLEQTCDPGEYEVLVVDDQSTDDTLAWLQEAEKTDSRLHALPNPSKGRAQARNTGLRAAQGKYLCFVDDDVWVVPGFVKAHCEAHQSAGDKAVVIGALGKCSETEPTLPNVYEDERLARVERRIQQAGDNLDAGFFRTGNVSVSREFLQEIGGFCEKFRGYSYEDSELGYRLMASGAKFLYAPEAAGVHFTQISLASILRKSTEAGRSAVIFLRLWPEAVGPVPAPFVVPGVPTTERQDGTIKRITKAVLFSAPARGLMYALLKVSLALGSRPLTFRLLSGLTYSRYAVAFRQAARESEAAVAT